MNAAPGTQEAVTTPDTAEASITPEALASDPTIPALSAEIPAAALPAPPPPAATETPAALALAAAPAGGEDDSASELAPCPAKNSSARLLTTFHWPGWSCSSRSSPGACAWSAGASDATATQSHGLAPTDISLCD